MILKLTQLASESISTVAAKFSLPPPLQKELEEFVKRNTIIDKKTANAFKLDYPCCPSCLKAHLYMKALELCIHPAVIQGIEQLNKEKIGHNGYYLDGNELIALG